MGLGGVLKVPCLSDHLTTKSASGCMSAGKAARPKADIPFYCEFTAGGTPGNRLPRSK